MRRAPKSTLKLSMRSSTRKKRWAIFTAQFSSATATSAHWCAFSSDRVRSVPSHSLETKEHSVQTFPYSSNVAPPISGGGGRLRKKSAKGHNPSSSSTRRGLPEARQDSTGGAAPMAHSPLTAAPQHPHITSHTHNTVLSLRGSERSPAFLPILLILPSDVETNPVPT